MDISRSCLLHLDITTNEARLSSIGISSSLFVGLDTVVVGIGLLGCDGVAGFTGVNCCVTGIIGCCTSVGVTCGLIQAVLSSDGATSIGIGGMVGKGGLYNDGGKMLLIGEGVVGSGVVGDGVGRIVGGGVA